MIGKIHRNLVFTQFDRFLLRNQAKPFVLTPDKKGESESDSSEPGEVREIKTRYQRMLIEGTMKYTDQDNLSSRQHNAHQPVDAVTRRRTRTRLQIKSPALNQSEPRSTGFVQESNTM